MKSNVLHFYNLPNRKKKAKAEKEKGKTKSHSLKNAIQIDS